MPRYVELSNGDLMEVRRPHDGVPFFSDWLEALLLRKAAYTTKEVDRKVGSPTFGQHIRVVKPYTKDNEQAVEVMEDGSVQLICIGCGGLTEPMQVGFQRKPFAVKQGAKALRSKSQSSMTHALAQSGLNQIFIGALIQRRIEEPCNYREGQRMVRLVQRWQRQTVRKGGQACPECLVLYTDEFKRVEAENKERRDYVNIAREVYLQRGQMDKLKALVEPKEYLPFLDVLNHSVPMRQIYDTLGRIIGA